MDKDPQMQGNQPENAPTPAVPPVSADNGGVQPNVLETEKVVPSVAAPTPSVVPSTPVAPAIESEQVNPPKKKRTGLLAGLIVLLIAVLAAVGAAVWYFCFYSNPDKVAYDAIVNFIEQPNVVTEGAVVVKAETDDGGIFSVVADIDTKTNGAAGESAVNLKLDLVDQDDEVINSDSYELGIGNIITSDGVFYIRVDKLIDIVDAMLSDMETSVAELGEGFEVIYDVLDEVDGEWWRISVPELVDEFIEDNSIARPIKEFYACFVDATQQDMSAQMVELYNQNRFVDIEKIEGGLFGGDSKYRATLNYDKMAAFMNGTLDIESEKGIEDCASQLSDELGGSYSFDKTYTNTSELEKYLNDFEVEMTISNFGHELRSISVSMIDLGEDEKFVASFKFAHPEVEIVEPTSYRSIAELFERAAEVFIEYYNSINPKSPWNNPSSPWNDYEYDYDGYYSWDDDWGDDWA